MTTNELRSIISLIVLLAIHGVIRLWLDKKRYG